MNEYKNEVSSGLKHIRWTFFKGFPLYVIIVIVLSAFGFALNSLGLFSQTVVEREVFTHSYQRNASLKAKLANNKAVIAELNGRLTNPSLDDSTRANLNAQLSAARIRINTTKETMQ